MWSEHFDDLSQQLVILFIFPGIGAVLNGHIFYPQHAGVVPILREKQGEAFEL
jgi:hypothetical protein